ncbi:hypothetical protein JCM14244_05860 [Venenivibrio stagnispumantis]|uniref:Tetratricopeptide repeat-containing protein n=1 Tax=Venenivibrio stagnispumantis TaxID=407998 RepID=A0AA45WIA3_9AQUI|nr:tetratricopeptide repeat protein [Venenivibrio stagnispumantis]MCW4572757.1 cellulose synthase subunit BcsC-related outer membrane protein [Venenivibrio stagnispumantis]SMP00300.1 Tetratricopeptide repeat-containing protein [Venenivibrio stagnispumantis]
MAVKFLMLILLLFNFSFAFYLKIPVKSEKEINEKLKILQGIGFNNCIILKDAIICDGKDDIYEFLRARDYLRRYNIISYIVEDKPSFIEKSEQTKKEEKPVEKSAQNKEEPKKEQFYKEITKEEKSEPILKKEREDKAFAKERIDKTKAEKKEQKDKTVYKADKKVEEDLAGKNLFCIQLGASTNLSKDLLSKYENIKNYPFARIEKIDGYFKLLIGAFKNRNEASSLLKELKSSFKDAFIRECNIDKSRIVYPKNQDYQISTSSDKKEITQPKQKDDILEFMESKIYPIKKEETKENIDNIQTNTSKKEKSIESPEKNSVELLYENLNSGNLDKAEDIAQNLLRKNPKSFDAYFVLGIINLKKNEFKSACSYLEKAYQLNKRKDAKNLRDDACFAYYINQGYSNIETRPLVAISLFKNAKEYKYDIKADIGIGYAYINAKDYEKAYLIFKNLYDRYPDNDDILKGYIITLNRLNKKEELNQVISTLPKERLKNLSDIYLYVEIENINKLIKERKFDEAEAKLKELYNKYPSNINVLLAFGNLYTEQGNYLKAKDFYENILILEPDNIYALQGLKLVYIKEGNYDKAIEIIEKLERKGIKVEDKEKIYAIYYLNKAEELKKQGNLDEAKRIYENILKTQPDNTLALIGIGDIYQKKGNKKEAFNYYSKAYSLAKDNFDIKIKFLYALLDLNLFAQIKTILEDIDINKLSLEQQRELKKFYKALYIKYATYLYENKDYEMALRVAREGILLFPEDSDLIAMVGWSFYQLKDYQCAEDNFKTSYTLSGDEKIAIGLAYVYLNTGKKEQLKQLLQKLENSTNPEILVDVANIYASIGDYKKAEKTLENAKILKNQGRVTEFSPKSEETKVIQTQPKTIEKPKTIIPNPFIQQIDTDFDLKKNERINYNSSDIPEKDVAYIDKQENSDINKKIEQVKKMIEESKQNYISNVSIGGKFRYKSGDIGTGKLLIFSPFVKGEYFLKPDLALYYGAYYPFISSGGKPDYTKFGTVDNPVIRDTDTSASGLEPFLGIKYNRDYILRAELSYSPIGNTAVKSTFLGNFEIGKVLDDNKITVEAGRYSEKNTLLSYVGAQDPHSNNSWGRVTETRLGVNYERMLDKNDSLIFSSLRYGKLEGENTNKNDKIDVILLPKIYIGENILTKDYVGLYTQFMSYKKDEDSFYYGEGGYFSPKSYLMLAPMYEGYYFSKDSSFGLMAKIMAGLLSIKTSKYTENTFAFDGFFAIEKLLTSRISAYGGLDLRKTASYSELFYMMGINYYFDQKNRLNRQDLQKYEKEIIK